MDYSKELLETIVKICSKGKGILAADESTGTIGKRFSQIDVINNLENRIRYRKLLFTTSKLNNHISGVITFDETLRNKDLVKPLLDSDIVLGIKLDKGVRSLYLNGETVSQGLDGLEDRCKEYYNLGARFAKWRSVLKIDNNCPSDLSINQNAEVLARYASICQKNGLVPIVEPEILMEGAHDIVKCSEVTENVLSVVYRKLMEHRVNLETTLLKPNMVRPGVDNKNKSLDDIAYYTIRTLRRVVPVAVPGIMFLSGGMSEEQASEALHKLNIEKGHKPWYLSFSYGRALQYSVLMAWRGDDNNIIKAQDELIKRCKLNGLATLGMYREENERGKSLHIDNYSY